MALRAYEKRLEFGCMIDYKVPSLLCGDPGRLRQVLINLVGNAIKFTEKGEVSISVLTEEEDSTRVTMRFDVIDTGIGIPQERMDRLFKSFSQVDRSTTRKYGGTGLGLAISKKLVEMMGGLIGFERKPDGGSIFRFRAVFDKQPQSRYKRILIPENISGKRILIVDDNATNRHVLKEQLKSWGCSFSEASSGKQALEELLHAAAHNEPYDIAILDMQMPEMDGETLGKKIKENPVLAKTLLIMLTSLGMRGDAERFKKIGFSAYLTKPVKQSQLYNCLIAVTGRQKEAIEVPARTIITRHSIAEEEKQRIHILLAEDDITNQKVAMNMLEKSGYNANVVANGKEAIRALEMIPYHLVLMDVQMPEMDGFTATREIRNSKLEFRDIPIIAMTAHAMKGDREKCLDAGMDDYLSKPINPQELLGKIEKWALKKEKASCEISRGTDTAPVKPKHQAPIDFDSALGRAMGNRELLEMLLTEFIATMPAKIKDLKASTEKQNAEELERQAHTLKGASASLSAEKISELALQLELMARKRKLDDAKQVIDNLEEELGRLSEYIHHAKW